MPIAVVVVVVVVVVAVVVVVVVVCYKKLEKASTNQSWQEVPWIPVDIACSLNVGIVNVYCLFIFLCFCCYCCC